MALVCSHGDWRADVLRIVECYARTWGGDGHGLISCNSEWGIAEPFWRLAEAFDADHWAAFARTGRGLQLKDPLAYETQLAAIVKKWAQDNGVDEAQARQMIEPQFLQSGTGLVAPPELGERIRRRMAPLASTQVAVTAEFRADEAPPHRLVDMCALTYQPARITGLDVVGLPPAVQLLVAARTGLVAPEHLARLRERGETERVAVPVDREGLAQVLRFAWTGRADTDAAYAGQAFLDDTPFVQSRLGCSWFTAFSPDVDDEPVVVMCGDSAEDFCYAYTRRRVVGETHWLPLGPDTEDFSTDLYTELGRVLYDLAAQPSSGRPVLLSSLTLDEGRLHEIRDQLLATPWGRMASSGSPGRIEVSVCAPADLPVRRHLHLLDKERAGDTLHEPFLGTDQARNIEIPLPSEAVGSAPDSCRWQVDVLEPRTVLPARWALREVVTADPASSWGVRSSTNGISIDSHGRIFTLAGTSLAQRLVQVRLRFPTVREVFTTLLAPAGVTLEESDKGRYTRRMIELWGDFATPAADLTAGTAADLLSAWICTAEQPGRVYQGRKYLTLADVHALTGGSEEASRHLLDGYLQRSIAARGLLLTCAQCVGTAFYQLEDIGPGFRCQRCRQHNPIVRSAWKGQELEPQWYYGLDEVAYQGLRSNIHVPILALAQLAESAQSFQHMPEAVVHRDGYPDLEVDLWAVIDGRIVLGEAKISDRLENTRREETQRCAALKGLINDLSADEFVMATTGPGWYGRTQTLVNEKIAPAAKITWLTSLR